MARPSVFDRPTMREWLLIGLLLGAITDKIICLF